MLPLSVFLEPNGYWAGIDGNWSTWSVSTGTPPQQFQVWPSTSSGEVWLPLPDGCPPTEFWSTVECAASRGVDSSEGPRSVGFQKNVSSTWEEIGIYELLTVTLAQVNAQHWSDLNLDDELRGVEIVAFVAPFGSCVAGCQLGSPSAKRSRCRFSYRRSACC